MITIDSEAEKLQNECKMNLTKSPRFNQTRVANLKQMKQLFNDWLVSRVQHLYKFEPRRKYVEELVDTDDSDAQPITNKPSASVIAVADGKIACETCGKCFKPRGIFIRKATHRK